ncbi:MAG: hypothetical protein IMY86_02790 [Chloroflexi bacterium]|nr:hypothetical protein [Chloroflexota bacterium]
MCSDKPPLPQTNSFVVRIWWEPGLTRPDDRPLWRGYVQHAASGQSVVFQSLDEMLRFIQSQTGELENKMHDTYINKGDNK